MALKRVDTFEREVKFTRPGPKLGQFTADGFTVEFKVQKPSHLAELRARPQGLKDPEFVKLTVARVIDPSDTSVDEILDDAVAIGACVREYHTAIGEGISGKNSET